MGAQTLALHTQLALDCGTTSHPFCLAFLTNENTCLTYTTLHAPHHHSKKRRALRQDRGTRQTNEPIPHQHHHYDSHGDAHLETRRHRLRGCPVASLVVFRA